VDDVFDNLFGDERKKAQDEDIRNAQQRSAKRKAARARVARPKKKVLKPAANNRTHMNHKHVAFLTELVKNPSNPTACYRIVYPGANEKTANRRAHELLNRTDVSAELNRLQKLRAAKASMTRARMEEALVNVFSFDIRRLFYSEAEAAELNAAIDANTKLTEKQRAAAHVEAGDPKKPHHLDDEAARVMDSYEKSQGRYGPKVKMRTTARLPAAELVAKLKGWVKDDGRPPITANFNFNFGPKPGSPEEKVVEAVPVAMYGPMGLREADQPAEPPPKAVDEHGNLTRSTLPAGYEPGRGVRIKSRGSELAADIATVEDHNDES
jgi:hypothetical protein